MLISEIKNDLPQIKPVKEIMSIYIDGINPNIPNGNGFIYALIGSPAVLKKVHYRYCQLGCLLKMQKVTLLLTLSRK